MPVATEQAVVLGDRSSNGKYCARYFESVPTTSWGYVANLGLPGAGHLAVVLLSGGFA